MNPPDPLKSHAGDFDRLGRAFCTLDKLWINLSYLGQPYPEALCDIGPWHSTRYRNDQTKREGIIAELYDFIPSHFHKHLEKSPFFATKVCLTVTSLEMFPHSFISVSRWAQFNEELYHQQCSWERTCHLRP